jgi:hypothetical protein
LKNVWELNYLEFGTSGIGVIRKYSTWKEWRKEEEDWCLEATEETRKLAMVMNIYWKQNVDTDKNFSDSSRKCDLLMIGRANAALELVTVSKDEQSEIIQFLSTKLPITLTLDIN